MPFPLNFRDPLDTNQKYSMGNQINETDFFKVLHGEAIYIISAYGASLRLSVYKS